MSISGTSTDGSVITPAYVVVSHTHAGYAFGTLQLVTLITGKVHSGPSSANQEDIKAQIIINICAYLLMMRETGKHSMNTESTMHFSYTFIQHIRYNNETKNVAYVMKYSVVTWLVKRKMQEIILTPK